MQVLLPGGASTSMRTDGGESIEHLRKRVAKRVAKHERVQRAREELQAASAELEDSEPESESELQDEGRPSKRQRRCRSPGRA